MMLFDEPNSIFAAKPDIICEAMGGTELPRELVLRALEAGIPVVTANKQLVARHGAELFAAAAAHDVQLRFEASVCAAIPVVRMLRESLVPARIDRVLGILNGTTNYILTKMSADGADFADALEQAQELGYAEPDPTDDLSGSDVAAKLAILTSIAFHTRVTPEEIDQRGIDHIRSDDIDHASTFGFRIRMIGRSQRISDSEILASVSPMLIAVDHPLASVQGPTNAVMVHGHPCGKLIVQGPGAGGPETASALAGDIVGVLGSTPSFLTSDPHVHDMGIADPESSTERHYVRMQVRDQPGVLATVATQFAERNISIERVIQHRSSSAGIATLVMLTHPAPRHHIEAAAHASATPDDVLVIPVLEDAA